MWGEWKAWLTLRGRVLRPCGCQWRGGGRAGWGAREMAGGVGVGGGEGGGGGRGGGAVAWLGGGVLGRVGGEGRGGVGEWGGAPEPGGGVGGWVAAMPLWPWGGVRVGRISCSVAWMAVMAP